jgi:hypothetical protein
MYSIDKHTKPSIVLNTENMAMERNIEVMSENVQVDVICIMYADGLALSM